MEGGGFHVQWATHKKAPFELQRAGAGQKSQEVESVQGKLSVRMVAEIGVMLALSTVLAQVRLFHAPYGGSVTLASMVPLLYLAFRWGPGVGILAGAAEGLIHLAIDPEVVHPIQLILDYPLAFGLVGLAGFFPRRPMLGTTAGLVARFLSHLISGVFWWASYTPPDFIQRYGAGAGVWLYSFAYNGAYMGPELVISLVFVYFLRKYLFPEAAVAGGSQKAARSGGA